MGQEFQMIAKTFKGLESVLADELVNLGANNVQQDRRAVSFTGDKALMYKANLYLRTASRILKPIATSKVRSTDDVYNLVKSVDWSQYMTVGQTFAIDSTVYSEEFNNSQFIKYRAKDAIVDWFMEHEERRPSIRIDNPDIYLNIHISHDVCTVSLDSSGESLHKRGYRDAQTEAPINEALAAGLLLMAGWDGQTNFIDPMCGSGTFLIEAALIALNIPPCIYRKSFAFEKWSDFDAELFDFLYNDDSSERTFDHKIIGCDISPRALQIADANIKAAGLSKYITLERRDIAEWEAQTEPCLIVTNPPYGERLAPDDIFALYDQIGKTFKHSFSGNTAWVISSNKEAMQKIGLHASEKIDILNGALECEFHKYELFTGRRDDFVKDRKSSKYEERKPRFEAKDDADDEHRTFERKPRKDWGHDDHKSKHFDSKKSRENKFGDHTDRHDHKRFEHRKPFREKSEDRFEHKGPRFSDGKKFEHKRPFRKDEDGSERRFGDRKPAFGRKPHSEHSSNDFHKSSKPKFGQDREHHFRKRD